MIFERVSKNWTIFNSLHEAVKDRVLKTPRSAKCGDCGRTTIYKPRSLETTTVLCRKCEASIPVHYDRMTSVQTNKTRVHVKPYVFLRCSRCEGKTIHAIGTATVNDGEEVKEGYACQGCGETKVIYEILQ